MTPAGQEALGSYKQGMIKILGGQADAKETMYHEAVHAYLDMFTTKGEQSNLLDVAQKHYGIDDFGEVEEKLAEDFINYAKTHEGTVGQLRAHFDNVLERIKKYFGNEDAVKKLYSDLYTGKAKQTLSEAKGYKAQVGLVQEAITSGDEAAAKSIYKGITKSDYLPSYEKIAKNVKQKRFSAGLAAQAERDMAGYEKALSQRDLIEEAIGEKNIDSVRRLIRSKAAQKSDFDVNKIPGFDEMADEVRTIKNNPQLTDNEVLDMIEKLPTKAEIKKMKPVKIEPVEDLKIIEPEEVGKIEKINEAGGEVVKVPKKQLPIGEGKEKVSKLAARVQGITGKATKEDIERLGLRTYNQMNNKKAIAKSAEFVSNKWDDGLKVLKGEIDPPAGTNEGSIYVAMTQLAKDDSSGKLATDLMGLKATAMGQNTEILKEIDKNNPIKHIDDLIKRKIEAVGGDEKITKMVSKEKSQLKTLSKSETIKGTKQWAERLEQLRC